jgi:hypothetical protein
MRKDTTWKSAILALIGLVAVASVGMNATAKSRSGGGGGSAAVAVVDCNIRDPLSPCFDTKTGYPAGDLLILGDF